MLKVGDVLNNIEAIDYSSEGLSIARFETYTLFIESLLKGEVGDIKITYLKGKDIAFAKAIKIHKLSPFRISSSCPIHSACGGCSFQTLDYQEELQFKKEKVRNVFKKFAHMDIEVKDVSASPSIYEYRNKIEIPLSKDLRNNLILGGLYRKNSHKIIPFSHCNISKPCLEKVLFACIEVFNKYHISTYDELTRQGLLRHLVIRCNKNDEVMLTIVTSENNLPHKIEIIKELISKNLNIKSIILNVNDKVTNVILGEKEILLYGEPYILENILGLNFKVSSKSFLQINHEQCENLYKKAIDIANLSKDDIVLDAYSGIGTIGLCLAKHVKYVHGVEIVKEAIEDAKENMKLNNIKNARYEVGDAGKYLLSHKDIKFDVVFVDPPRKGLSLDFINVVKESLPKKIIYISCHPATLARDVELLKDYYEVKEVIPFDMFPRTSHVETVVCLINKGYKD